MNLDKFPNLFFHCTPIENLKSLFNEKYLYTQSDRKKLNLSVTEGEGSLKRQVFPPKMPLLVKGSENFNTKQEAEGIYFRVVPPKCQENSVALVFDREILIPNEWHINTNENNGFYIDEPGIYAEGPWASDRAATYDTSNQNDYSINVDSRNPPRYHELVVHKSIPIKLIKYIIARKDQVEKIKNLGIDVDILTLN